MSTDLPSAEPHDSAASSPDRPVPEDSQGARAPRAQSSDLEEVGVEPRRRAFLPHLILAIGLVLTAAVTVYLDMTAEARDRRRFRAMVAQTEQTVESRLDLYVALLKAGALVVAARPLASAEEVRGQLDALKLHLHLGEAQRFGLSRRVRPTERASFEGEARRRDALFHLHPEPRGDAFPIVDIEPRGDAEPAALGFDLASDPVRWAAMERAQDSGVPVATERVPLTAEAGGAAPEGLVIYAPVYADGHMPGTVEARRQALTGFVFLALRGEDLFEGITGGMACRLGVDFEIYSGPEGQADDLLLRSSKGRAARRGDPRFTSAALVEAAGRPFWLSFKSRPEFESASSKVLVPCLLSAGLVLSVALFLAMRARSQARVLAESSAMDRRLSERALREGERKLEELYRAEGEARHSAEVATRVRDEFLATLSHELRTPLTAMMGWIQMLRGGALDEAARARGIAVIERNVKLQAQLVEDLLDVSQIITGRLCLAVRPVSLAPIVSAAMDAVRSAADARGITLSVAGATEDLPLAADPDRLRQVFWNLLTNAIRFTPHGGRVEVRIERRGVEAEVSISDNGRGIAAAFLPYVFDRFRQADSSTTYTSGGLGLGLAIVRHLVELHGGTVTASSAGEGRGARFTVLLPISTSGARDDDRSDCASTTMSPG